MRKLTIGRSSSCDIIIPDNNVSRVHAEISRNGNEFVYHDMGKNGSTINGRIIHNERVIIAPGTTVLLANRIPLPWGQIYSMLPGGSNVPSEQETHVGHVPQNQGPVYVQPYKEDRLGFGWGLLAFLIPLAGWIMYFCWKEETPKRAGNAGLIGTISFILNLLTTIVCY